MDSDNSEENITSASKTQDSNKRSASNASLESSPAKKLAVENSSSESNSKDCPSSNIVEDTPNPQNDQKVSIITDVQESGKESPGTNEKASPKKSNLKEIFKEILLKNVEGVSIKGSIVSNLPASCERPSPSFSLPQTHPLSKMEIDIVEADTSFVESFGDVKEPQEMASSSISTLKKVPKTDEDSSNDKEETNSSLSEVALGGDVSKQDVELPCKGAPVSNVDEKTNDDALTKTEDYSAIEDALKSMISDVEHSNLEPISLDDRDLKDDFLSDKAEVSSSSGIEFQPGSFLVSSTSEDGVELHKDVTINNPEPCLSEDFKGAISNDLVSASDQSTIEVELMEDSKLTDDRLIGSLVVETAESTSVTSEPKVEKEDENKPSSESVSTTTEDKALSNIFGMEENLTMESAKEVEQLSDVPLVYKELPTEPQLGAAPTEDSPISNLIKDDSLPGTEVESDLLGSKEYAQGEKTNSPECDESKPIAQVREHESKPSILGEEMNSVSDEMEQEDVGFATDQSVQGHEPQPKDEAFDESIANDNQLEAKGEALMVSTEGEDSLATTEQQVSESSLLQEESRDKEDSILITPDKNKEEMHVISCDKQTDASMSVSADKISGENATTPHISLAQSPMDVPSEDALVSTAEDQGVAHLSSVNDQNKSSFAEPFKAAVNEDMETECADSSTVVSVGSADNIDSFAPTPCDSGETSPSLSTPAGSCQVSAAPSPLSKPLEDDQNLVSSLLDDNSLDSKFMDDDSRDNTNLPDKKSKGASKKKDKNKTLKRKDPVIVDEETRMDAGSNGISDIPMDEDSQGSLSATSKKKVRSFRCEVIVPESTEIFTADKVAEYMWPLEGFGEHYFIQEHISQYLGIMSFKRKYPDLRRRPIESQEKEYLKENGFVNEMACDLGLTAVRSEDVFDVMFNDFPSKYEELQRVLRERKELQLKEKGKVEYQMMDLDKSKLQEYGRKAAHDAARWNAAFNRERREERRYTFDLQTFTVHKPVNLYKKLPSELTKMGSYPVAVLPGQYTDVSKDYSSAELRCMPLQTVLSGPFTAEELNIEANTNVSDDESAPASVGTCSTEKEILGEKESEACVTDSAPTERQAQPRCKECNGTKERNKHAKPEPLIICGSCRAASHPTCIELTLTMIEKIESYSWQCMECKTCAQCNDPDDEERMIFCDMCDRGYHIYCVGLRRVPQGRWHCKECAFCFSCGSRTPSGNEHIKNAEWQHEYKKEKDVKQLKYACTLCMPCDKYWKRRQFCYVCMKVYRSIPEDGMVKCTGCPKYVHREGCSTLQDNERYCTYCFKTRNKTALNHSRIIAAAKKKMASGY